MIAALALVGLLAAQAPSAITEVRVHGNHSTPDAAVLELAGVKAGDPFTGTTAREVETRLRRSGRFSRVEVVTRSRSLDGRDLSLIILVEEHLVVPVDMPGGAILNPVRRLAHKPMFLPILDVSDYGFSYGARASFVNLTGRGSRLSFPFTWGAEKRAAAEYEHRFGPERRARINASASWLRRENPFYDVDDTRREVSGGAAYEIARPLRAGLRAGITDVSGFEGFDGFDGSRDGDQRFPWVAADVTLDTRIDPDLPREAVYASVSLERLAFERSPHANRLRTDLRGYLGLIGQSVVAVRALHVTSDTPLPAFERALLGGASTLRGSKFGFASGDNLAAGSIELRLPVTSPMSVGRLGVNVFADVGAAYDHGTALGDADFTWGYGAGVFFSATIFRLNVDVATDGRGRTRTHVASGFRF